MLRTTPVSGDPETDFVFQRIFGSEDHKTALIGFLNDVLELDDAHRVVSVMLLTPEGGGRHPLRAANTSVGRAGPGASGDRAELWPFRVFAIHRNHAPSRSLEKVR